MWQYHTLKLFDLLRVSVVLFLIVNIAATPIIYTAFYQLDIKYELCEIYGEEDVKEKEMIVDYIKDEDLEFYSLQNISIIPYHTFSTEFNPDIKHPPPKKG